MYILKGTKKVPLKLITPEQATALGLNKKSANTTGSGTPLIDGMSAMGEKGKGAHTIWVHKGEMKKMVVKNNKPHKEKWKHHSVKDT